MNIRPINERGDLRRLFLLLPAAMVFAGLFLVPLAFFVVISFWQKKSFAMLPAFVFDNYQRVATNYGDVLLFTLGLALVTAFICLVWGFFFAYAVRFRAGRFGDALIVVTLLTLFGGYLVKIYAWKSILGSEGIINGGLIWLGLIEQPITFLIYSPVAVVIALANFLLPFVILPVYAALRNVREVTIEAARDLGAGPWTIIRAIVLPQIRPGLIAGFVFAFLMAAGDYVTPMFLGGTSGSMFGQFIAIEFSTRFNWPVGAAMSLSLLLASLAVVAIVSFLIGRLRHVRGV